VLLRTRANNSPVVRFRTFLTGFVVSLGGARGPSGGGSRGNWSSPRPEAQRPYRRREEEKGIQSAVEKAAGDEHAFIPSRDSGWQMGRHAGHGGR